MKSIPIAGSTPSEYPAVVGKRNHFESASGFIDLHWLRLPKELQTPELRNFLEAFTAILIRRLAWDFGVGAQRGIEQAAKLIVDPEFYATKKERLKKERLRREAYSLAQEEEKREREQCPTAEQIQETRRALQGYIAGYKRQISAWEERLAGLPENPKHIRMPESRRGK